MPENTKTDPISIRNKNSSSQVILEDVVTVEKKNAVVKGGDLAEQILAWDSFKKNTIYLNMWKYVNNNYSWMMIKLNEMWQ